MHFIQSHQFLDKDYHFINSCNKRSRPARKITTIVHLCGIHCGIVIDQLVAQSNVTWTNEIFGDRRHRFAQPPVSHHLTSQHTERERVQYSLHLVQTYITHACGRLLRSSYWLYERATTYGILNIYTCIIYTFSFRRLLLGFVRRRRRRRRGGKWVKNVSIRVYTCSIRSFKMPKFNRNQRKNLVNGCVCVYAVHTTHTNARARVDACVSKQAIGQASKRTRKLNGKEWFWCSRLSAWTVQRDDEETEKERKEYTNTHTRIRECPILNSAM